MDKRRKYNWKEIQDFYDSGKSIRECCEHFKVTWGAIQKARNRNEIILNRTISEGLKLAFKTGRTKVRPLTDKGREALRNTAIKNELGGKRNSKRFNYNGIILDSSYEVRLAKVLDRNKIKWERPKKIMWIDDSNIKHRYYPDFFLVDYGYFIDTKNDYLAERDKRKIELVSSQNNIIIKILTLNDIKMLEENNGVVAQLAEQCVCNAKVKSSNLFDSTKKMLGTTTCGRVNNQLADCEKP
jgi:hypothetical protein